MTRTFLAILVLIASTAAAAETPAQVKPVQTWLKAVKAGDQKLFMTVYSERMRKILEKEGWDKSVKSYQQSFRAVLGNYNVEDFTFEYTGGDDKGKVASDLKGKKLPAMRVVKEQGGWKLDER